MASERLWARLSHFRDRAHPNRGFRAATITRTRTNYCGATPEKDTFKRVPIKQKGPSTELAHFGLQDSNAPKLLSLFGVSVSSRSHSRGVRALWNGIADRLVWRAGVSRLFRPDPMLRQPEAIFRLAVHLRADRKEAAGETIASRGLGRGRGDEKSA